MWIHSFYLLKSWKTCLLALVGLTNVKGRSVRKKIARGGGPYLSRGTLLATFFIPNSSKIVQSRLKGCKGLEKGHLQIDAKKEHRKIKRKVCQKAPNKIAK